LTKVSKKKQASGGGLRRCELFVKLTPHHLLEGFVITLDGRKLKTPDGHIVIIPHNKKTLALLVAAEWEAQEKVLKSYSLPLTSIVVRALDSFPEKSIRTGVIDNLIRYFKTDTICYMQDEPSSMVDMQNEYWTPLIEWAESKFHLSITTSSNSIMGVNQSQESLDKFRSLLETYDDLTLAGKVNWIKKRS
jgi:ATP synthase F1 complex assembly factor 2